MRNKLVSSFSHRSFKLNVWNPFDKNQMYPTVLMKSSSEMSGQTQLHYLPIFTRSQAPLLLLPSPVPPPTTTITITTTATVNRQHRQPFWYDHDYLSENTFVWISSGHNAPTLVFFFLRFRVHPHCVAIGSACLRVLCTCSVVQSLWVFNALTWITTASWGSLSIAGKFDSVIGRTCASSSRNTSSFFVLDVNVTVAVIGSVNYSLFIMRY